MSVTQRIIILLWNSCNDVIELVVCCWIQFSVRRFNRAVIVMLRKTFPAWYSGWARCAVWCVRMACVLIDSHLRQHGAPPAAISARITSHTAHTPPCILCSTAIYCRVQFTPLNTLRIRVLGLFNLSPYGIYLIALQSWRASRKSGASTKTTNIGLNSNNYTICSLL